MSSQSTLPASRRHDEGGTVCRGERTARAGLKDPAREPLFFIDDLLLLKHDAVRFVTGFYAKGYRPFIDFDCAALVRRDGDMLLG